MQSAYYAHNAAYGAYPPGAYPRGAASAYDPYGRQQQQQYPMAAGGYDYYSYAYHVKYNAWIEEMKKNPAAYSEWYQRTYGQRYAPSVTTGPGTVAGSVAPSEADRASVHSGRSSVNDELQSTSHAIRGSTTGLEQIGSHDYNVFHVYILD